MVSIMEYGPTPSQQAVQPQQQPIVETSIEQAIPTECTEIENRPRTGGKSAVSQRSIELRIATPKSVDSDLAKRALKLELVNNSGSIDVDDFSVKSPKSPLATSVRCGRLPHQKSLTSQVDLEDRKTLRDALYQGIFHRHRRTIFAVGSFLRMLRSRNSQYNTIRSSSEGEDIDETR